MAVDVGDPPFGEDREEEQQVVIEKDGVFKVVSALEVHAEGAGMDETGPTTVHKAGTHTNTEHSSGNVDALEHQTRQEGEKTTVDKHLGPADGKEVPPTPIDAGEADKSPAVDRHPEQTHGSVSQPLDLPSSGPVDEQPDKPVPLATAAQEGTKLPQPENGLTEKAPSANPLYDQPSVAQPPHLSSNETTEAGTTQPSAKEEDSGEKEADGGKGSEVHQAATEKQSQVSSHEPSQQATTTSSAPETEQQRQLPQSIGISQPDTISSPSPGAKALQNKAKSASQRNQSALVSKRTHAKDTAIASANQERKRMNDLAFEAWLSKKNKEVLKRRELERKQGPSHEEIEQKKRENEQAFRHWLATKKREANLKLHSPSSTKEELSAEEKEKENYIAWQSWLAKKLEQRRRENHLEAQKKKEMNEFTAREDRDVCEHAFKTWLWQKKFEDREERRRRELQKKAFCRESRQLAQSMKRFTGF